MPRIYVRKSDRGNYCKEKLAEAIRKVQAGVLTGYEAAVRYNVPRSTLMDRVSGRHGRKSRSMGKPPVLPENLEKKLAKILRFMKANGFCLSKKELLELVGEYVRSSKNEKVKGFYKTRNPGGEWFKAFAARNALDTKLQGEQGVKEAGLTKVKEYFALLNKVSGELNLCDKPVNLWNIEETSFRITSEGCVRTSNTDIKRNATVVTACNAAGKKAPLLIILKDKNQVSDNDDDNDNDDDDENCYTVTKEGWLERAKFREYFTKSFLTSLRDIPPILLTFNGHSSHIDMKLIEEARTSDIIFLRTPLQKDLSVFNCLKFKWDDNFDKWQKEHIGCEIPEREFAEIVTRTFSDFKIEDIQDGFKNAGIFPFNDSVCNDLFYADSEKHTVTIYNDTDDDDDETVGAGDFEMVDVNPIQEPSIKTGAVEVKENPADAPSEIDESSSESSEVSESESSSDDDPPCSEMATQTLPLPKKRKQQVTGPNNRSSPSILRQTLQQSKPTRSYVQDLEDYERLIEAATTIRAPNIVCCVFGCRNNSFDQQDKKFFHFPNDQQRRSEWLKLINREDLASKLKYGNTDNRVCSDHFDEYDYTHGMLSKDALPHLGLPKKRAKFVYEPDADAGPSGIQTLPQVKIENTDSEVMEVEIKFEPEEPPQIKFNEPTIPPIPTINFRPTILPRPILPSTLTPAVPPLRVLRPILRPSSGIIRPVGVETLPVIQNSFKIVDVEHDIHNSVRIQTQTSKKDAFLRRATISAIEQINLDPIPPVVPETSSIHIQTTKKLVDLMNLPMKRKYDAEKRDAQKKIRYLEKALNNPKMNKTKFLECCDRFLDEKIANIVKSHATLLDKYQGNRYSNSFKTFALNLYLCSPPSYKFVEQFFYLPSMKTIQRSKIPVRTGINPSLIEGLKVKVDEMSEKEKICTVCFDYMGVNKNLYYDVTNDYLCGIQDIDQVLGSEPAQFAPLIMVRGLYSKWKQPVSFALVSKKIWYPALKEWLLKIIALLLDIGLKVKAFVADFDSEFLDFSDVSATEPYIEVNGQRIYQIFDVPNLYKNARDDLMRYDFHIGSKVAKWSHILKVYDADKKQELSLMPKITEQHVRAEEESKNGVKKAIQVFSRAVAAAMNFHVIANMTHKKTRDTIEFIKTMNDLFDMLNSRNTLSETEFKQSYKGTDEQKEFVMNTLEYLQMLEMKDKAGNTVEKKVTFVTGLVITIKSLISLQEDLMKENLRFISTKNLSKDCMETYFKKVRLLGGNCCARPTPIMFTRSFRRLFLTNLVNNTKEGGTVIDLKSTLTKISDYVKSDVKDEPEQNRSLSVGTSDYHYLWPIPSITYISGYLLWKIVERHACPNIIENLNKHFNLNGPDSEQLLSILKEFNADNVKRKDMPKPPESLVAFVDKMDEMFNDYYRRADMEVYSFGWNVYLTMEGEQFEMPCECFPLKSLKFLFIRLKIFHTVKDYNRKNKPTRRNWKGIRKRVPRD